MSDKTIELRLNIDETNLILEALGQLPFKQVYELIHNIQRQAQEQLEDKSTELGNAAE